MGRNETFCQRPHLVNTLVWQCFLSLFGVVACILVGFFLNSTLANDPLSVALSMLINFLYIFQRSRIFGENARKSNYFTLITI